MTIWIEQEVCSGCGICIKVCPYGAIEIIDMKAAINERCIECGACLAPCKEKAILTDAKEKTVPDFSDRKGIWVFAEQRGGVLNPVALELLGIGQVLAKELNQELSAIVLGDEIDDLIDPLAEFGADNIYMAMHPSLKYYRTIAYTTIISEMVREHKPNILLIGATHAGRDLAPRLARRLGAGLTADCTELKIDPVHRGLLQTRPAFGGNLMATIVNQYSRPQMATVRPGVMPQVKRKITREPRKIIKPVSLTEEQIMTKILEIVDRKRQRVDLNQAKVIVAGGRGAGSREGMKKLESLALALGGELGGTRVAVEEGWVPVDRQIGQTGQSVRPELYFACGISGAIQHRAGILGSRYIIAINKDPMAPIFKVADWGILGDLHEVIPLLIEKLRHG
ncbi:MAG: electron transfer flavoprotein subunit alpha [Deltaproteobacteria bacterium]|nr:electron transfer flavoprotein subunit alpha [Deltaproteobacteria bacterium]RLB35132.1 MAG: electron transfer flavoprotein subunit alpha [Deltaproteobacteria bacterium]